MEPDNTQGMLTGEADFWRSEANQVLSPRGREDEASRAFEALVKHGDKGRLLFAISGATGPPRWVVLRKSAMLAAAEAVNHWLRLTGDDRFLSAVPRFHVGGAGLHARAHLLDAEAWFVEGEWNPVKFCELIERLQISVVSMIPRHVSSLVRKGVRAPDGLQIVVVSGGILDPALASEAHQLGWPVLSSFGMTQAGSQIALETCRTDWSGLRVEGWLPVIDGWQLKSDRDGRLSIRGPGLLEGYWVESPSGKWQLEECVDGDGWFATRQLGQVQTDAGGQQWLLSLGGIGERVMINDEMVDLALVRKELAHIARGHGLSAERLFVVDMPGEGQNSYLVLAAERGQKDDVVRNVMDIFNNRFSGNAWLEGVRYFADLPRGEMGKVLSKEVRQGFLAGDE